MVGSVFPQMVLGGLLKIMTPHHKSFTNHLRLRRDWINHLYQLKFLTDGFLTSACTPTLMGTSVLYEHWAGISSLWLLCSPNSAFRSSRIYTPDLQSSTFHLDCPSLQVCDQARIPNCWRVLAGPEDFRPLRRFLQGAESSPFTWFMWSLWSTESPPSSVCFLQPNLVPVTPYFCTWFLWPWKQGFVFLSSSPWWWISSCHTCVWNRGMG